MEVAETKRDRVRRLLISKLENLGFRFPRDISPEKRKAWLARICDELAYCSDEVLGVLFDAMKSKGEGSARSFWPTPASFIGLAEHYQKRPIEELPAMASWFGSVKGPEARKAGIVVPTFLFILEHKRPPRRGAEDFRSLRVSNRWWPELEADIRRAQRRRDRRFETSEDTQMLAWVAGIEARIEALIRAGEAKRAEGEG